MDTIKLNVEGMSCNHCKMAVEKAVKGINGVESVQVSLDKREAIVTGSAARELLVQAIEDAGYQVTG